jgi:outer membrane lipoprotein carrier protein
VTPIQTSKSVILTLSLSKGKNPRISLPKPLLLALLCLCSTLAPAQPQQDLVRRVDDHYNHLRTLRAHYSEHYTGMGLDRTESGTLTLKKPGLMRWSYDKPTGKVFVLDGKFAWFYTPGDAQVSRTSAKQLDDLRSPLRFLLGHTQLAKELDQITTAPEGANFRIAGVPKGMAQRVRQLTLVVTQAGIIQSMKIEETDGSTTDFTFTGIEENAPVNPADFLFTPPPGVSIVDGQSPI